VVHSRVTSGTRIYVPADFNRMSASRPTEDTCKEAITAGIDGTRISLAGVLGVRCSCVCLISVTSCAGTQPSNTEESARCELFCPVSKANVSHDRKRLPVIETSA
jgi:hypothetical protein